MYKKGLTPLVIIILVVVGAVAFVLISKGIIKNPFQKSPPLGGQIFEKTQNPVSNLPETNPFSKLNPFKGVYKNPFE